MVRGFMREILSIAAWGTAALVTLYSFTKLLPTAKTYFFTTTTLATYKTYTALMKDVFSEIEAPEYGVWPANVLTALSGGSAGSATASLITVPRAGS